MLIAVIHHRKEIPGLRGSERRETEVIEDEQIGLGETRGEGAVASIHTGHGDVTEQW